MGDPKGKEKPLRECAVVNRFVEYQKRLRGYHSLRVDRWPDQENRQSPEIDAIAGPLAIEHTSIDAIQDQRRDDDWFLRLTNGLIDGCIDFGFTITLDYEATRDAIKVAIRKGKGLGLDRLRGDLERWISANAPGLSHGTHEIELPTSAPADPPIVMSIWKGQQPRIRGFRRAVNPDNDNLPMRVKSTLDKKARKLRKYHGSHRTILLVENSDIAFMNAPTMFHAFQEAYPDRPPQGVDEVWFADTSIPSTVDFWDLTPESHGGPFNQVYGPQSW